MAVRLRALLRPLLRRCRPQPRRRATCPSGPRSHLARAARRSVARVRRPLPCDPQRARAGGGARRARHGDCLRPQPPLHRPRGLAPAGGHAGDDHGGERLLRHHPGALGPRPGEAGGTGAGSGAGDTRQAALGAQQLPHAAGAGGDAGRPLRVRLRARRRLARARVPDARRCLDPPLLQPPPRRPHRVVDTGHGRGSAGRDRDLDQASGRRRLHEWARRPLRRSRADRRAALRHLSLGSEPHRKAFASRHPSRSPPRRQPSNASPS